MVSAADEGEGIARIWVDVGELTRACHDCLVALGLSTADATQVAEVVVEAELRGHDSHGVRLVPMYAPHLRSGQIVARPEVTVEARTAVSASVDARGGLGVLGARRAIDWCIETAATVGIAVAGVHRSNHLFIPGHYVLRAARAGLIALCTTVAQPVMPPAGGAGRVLGNNPLAVGIPVPGRDPFVLDIAPAASLATVKLHAASGRAIPPDWGVDAHGSPTTDPSEVLRGALRPLGLHKGAGLAMVAELLAGVLTGAGHGSSGGAIGATGHFFLVLAPSLLTDDADWAATVGRYLDHLGATVPVDPAVPVRYPGERAGQLERRARERGVVAIRSDVLAELTRLIEQLGLTPPPARPEPVDNQ